MARLSALLDRVHDEMPSVPKLVALRALSDAAKEFCTRSHAWQEELDAITVAPGEKIYEVSLDQGVLLAALKEARVDGVQLPGAATESTRLLRDPLPLGEPLGFVQWTPSTVQLTNASSEAHTMTLTAALTLRLGATDVDLPDDLIDEYGEYIAAGAKGRLARMLGQPWQSPDAAVGYLSLFYGAIVTAKARAMTALGEADVSVAIPHW